jgi:predicted secreted Zn-dependent protease
MKDKKDTRDDDVPGDVLSLLGEDGPKVMTQLINNIYDTVEWSRDFIEVNSDCLKEEAKSYKMQ